MNKYKVIAHQENNKPFSLTFEAFTTKHAGALFVSEMGRRGCSVVIDRLVGDPIQLSGTQYSRIVVLDRICRVEGGWRH